MAEKSEIYNPPLSENSQSAVAVGSIKSAMADFLVESVNMYAVVIGVDGRTIAINYQLLHALGYKKEELLNERFVQKLVYGPDQIKAASFKNKDWSARQLKAEIHL